MQKYKFSKKKFTVGFDKESGVIKSLNNTQNGIEYIANEINIPKIDVKNSRWFGDLIFGVKKTNQIEKYFTSISDKFRRVHFSEKVVVKYERLLSEAGEVLELSVTEEFEIKEEEIIWEIIIRNLEENSIEIGEFAIPVPFNNYYKGLTQNELYETKVISHIFPSGHSSYIIAQPLKGSSPVLMITPEEDTYLEAAAHETKFPFKSEGLKWEGIKKGYIYSKFLVDSGKWKRWFNGHTSLILDTGESKSFKFRLSWVENKEKIAEKLYFLGKVHTKIHPGLVVPKEMDVMVEFCCRKNIDNIEFGNNVRKIKTGKNLFRLKFTETGQKKISVQYDGSKWTNYFFMIIDNIENIIKIRARFIVNAQQYKNKNDGRYCAFLMWDTEEQALVTKARSSYLVGGSDELGFADPLFLAYKNVFYPVKKEINALEKYIDNFILKKLQNKDDYGIKLWYVDEEPQKTKGSSTIRSYNYPHLFNMYYYLYLISKLYNLTEIRDKKEYLSLSFFTAKAFYTLPMAKNANPVKFGNMGASNLLNILKALNCEGFQKEYRWLKEKVKISANFFFFFLYPYESEYNYDTTGHETGYFFREYIGREKLNRNVIEIILANRSIQPFWFWYGGDTRWGCGNAKYNEYEDEVCLSYMTPLNGLVLLSEYEKSGRRELLDMGFAAILSNWVAVNEKGEGFYLYDWEPRAKRFDPWTSEMGMGLWGALRGLKSYIYRDKRLGLIGYGCRVTEYDDRIIVYPHKGFNFRIFYPFDKINLELLKAFISKAQFFKTEKRMVLRIETKLHTPQKVYLIISSKNHRKFSLKNIKSPSEVINGDVYFELEMNQAFKCIEIYYE